MYGNCRIWMNDFFAGKCDSWLDQIRIKFNNSERRNLRLFDHGTRTQSSWRDEMTFVMTSLCTIRSFFLTPSVCIISHFLSSLFGIHSPFTLTSLMRAHPRASNDEAFLGNLHRISTSVRVRLRHMHPDSGGVADTAIRLIERAGARQAPWLNIMSATEERWDSCGGCVTSRRNIRREIYSLGHIYRCVGRDSYVSEDFMRRGGRFRWRGRVCNDFLDFSPKKTDLFSMELKYQMTTINRKLLDKYASFFILNFPISLPTEKEKIWRAKGKETKTIISDGERRGGMKKE